MKFVIQRVNHAEVVVEGNAIGKIGHGLLVFIGVGGDDTKEIADKYIKKLLGLRIFEDENGKTNLSLKDVNGELYLFRSLRFMRTAATATAHRLRMPESRNWQRNCMSTLLRSAENRCRLWKQGNLARI